MEFPLDTASVSPGYPAPPPLAAETRPDAHRVGMITFFISEVAFFSTLIMAYVIYLPEQLVGPTPEKALSLTLVLGTTLCLLFSSVTVHFAEKALHAGSRSGFVMLWGFTILLGALFLLGTGYEWYDLITRHHLTIGRNLFGTTFYTLVGFHGLHVTAGLIMLTIVLGLFLRGQIATPKSLGVELVAWYWHFVDGVWVVVFLVVYVLGR